MAFRGFPANTPERDAKPPCLRHRRPRILGGFRALPVGEGVRMQILVTGVSGYVGAALGARARARGPPVRGFARSPERVAAAGVALDDLVQRRRDLTGAGLERALDGVEVAYYLIHSMEGRPAARSPSRSARPRERFAAAAQQRPACGASCTSAGSCRPRAPSRATSPRGSPSRRRCCRRRRSRSRCAPRS